MFNPNYSNSSSDIYSKIQVFEIYHQFIKKKAGTHKGLSKYIVLVSVSTRKHFSKYAYLF